MHALYKQSTEGPADEDDILTADVQPLSPNDSGAFRKASINLKWVELGDMSNEQAKRLFLFALFDYAPYWKYESFS